MSGLRGVRVLVTGAGGYIPSTLVERLLAEGAVVRAFYSYRSDGSRGWLREVADRDGRLELVAGDVRDRRQVRQAVTGVGMVFHLAAVISVHYSEQSPHAVEAVNAGGTVNVIEAALDAGVRRVVHTSTSEVYGTPARLPITETHPVNPQSPYAVSKANADNHCRGWAAWYRAPAVILRPFNTYGPRQSTRAVIPSILSQLLAGERRVRVGRLDTVRDFTFVDDTVEAFVRIATADLPAGGLVHLGTGRAVSIGQLFELCCTVLGIDDAEPVVSPQRLRPAGGEVEALESDPTRARELLGWQPTVTLQDGLARTAAWLRGRVDAQRAAEYTR